MLPKPGEVVELQLLVDAADADGRRQFAMHFRIDDREWTRNASGTLGVATEADTLFERIDAWPPEDAEAVDTDWIVGRMAAISRLEYGPAFLGLEGAWRRGEEIYTEAALEEGADAGRHGLHPALLDMAMHGGFAQIWADTELAPGQGKLLFRWAGARFYATGASRLRIVSVPAGPDTIRVAAVTEDGRPALSIEAVGMRSVELDRLRTEGTGALHRVSWSEIEVPGGETEPEEVWWARGDDVRAVTAETLAKLQSWLAEERPGQLVIATEGAVAVERPDPVLAAVWGLVRSAQSEHPDRFVLADVDGDGPVAGAAGDGRAAGRRARGQAARPAAGQGDGLRRGAVLGRHRADHRRHRRARRPARTSPGERARRPRRAAHQPPRRRGAGRGRPRGRAGAARRRGPRRGLRPRRARAVRGAAGVRAGPGRRGARRGRAAGRDDRVAHARSARRRPAPQGRRRPPPGRADVRRRRLRVLLLASPARSARRARATTPPPTRTWTRSPSAAPGRSHWPGPVGARERHDRHARHGRHGPPGAARARRDRPGARPAAVRRGRRRRRRGARPRARGHRRAARPGPSRRRARAAARPRAGCRSASARAAR